MNETVGTTNENQKASGQATTIQQNTFATQGISDEFASWPASPAQVEAITAVKWEFHNLLCHVMSRIPPQNTHYADLVKTKLEEACMMAIKGITKP